MSEKMVLSVQDVAEELGLSAGTVYWMVKCGLPHRRIRGRGTKNQGKILISRIALEDWLKGEENEQRLGTDQG